MTRPAASSNASGKIRRVVTGRPHKPDSGFPETFAALPSQVLHEQMNYVASNEICNSRMMVLNDCLADGTLTLPEKPEASTVGMWIELR